MHSRLKRALFVLGIAALFVAAETPARAQDQPHVVSLGELGKDAARQAQTRQANEQALKSSKLDYQKVDKAIGQLSDEDLAKLGERSRRAQADFAAGRMSDRDLLWIIVIALGIIILALALH